MKNSQPVSGTHTFRRHKRADSCGHVTMWSHIVCVCVCVCARVCVCVCARAPARPRMHVCDVSVNVFFSSAHCNTTLMTRVDGIECDGT